MRVSPALQRLWGDLPVEMKCTSFVHFRKPYELSLNAAHFWVSLALFSCLQLWRPRDGIVVRIWCCGGLDASREPITSCKAVPAVSDQRSGSIPSSLEGGKRIIQVFPL